MRSVAFTRGFEGEDALTGRRGGREFEINFRIVFLFEFDAFDFFEGLDAGLYLRGFGGFSAEAFDESLGFFDFPSLILGGPAQGFTALAGGFFEIGIISVVNLE